MQHIAIDLGGRESQVCARSADGAITTTAEVSEEATAESHHLGDVRRGIHLNELRLTKIGEHGCNIGERSRGQAMSLFA